MMKVKKKKICRICDEKVLFVDYRNDKLLSKFLSEQGKILPRRITGNCARHQRQVSRAVKWCRHLAILPFVSDMTK